MQYLKLLQNNELSVVNQIPLIVQGFNNNSSVQLVGLKVHVLRKRAHKDNVMDRYTQVNHLARYPCSCFQNCVKFSFKLAV